MCGAWVWCCETVGRRSALIEYLVCTAVGAVHVYIMGVEETRDGGSRCGKKIDVKTSVANIVMVILGGFRAVSTFPSPLLAHKR
jgi:hypothetical protein